MAEGGVSSDLSCLPSCMNLISNAIDQFQLPATKILVSWLQQLHLLQISICRALNTSCLVSIRAGEQLQNTHSVWCTSKQMVLIFSSYLATVCWAPKLLSTAPEEHPGGIWDSRVQWSWSWSPCSSDAFPSLLWNPINVELAAPKPSCSESLLWTFHALQSWCSFPAHDGLGKPLWLLHISGYK